MSVGEGTGPVLVVQSLAVRRERAFGTLQRLRDRRTGRAAAGQIGKQGAEAGVRQLADEGDEGAHSDIRAVDQGRKRSQRVCYPTDQREHRDLNRDAARITDESETCVAREVNELLRGLGRKMV